MAEWKIKWRAEKRDNAPLLCRLFGHYWDDGWWGSLPYLRARSGPIDGISEHHIRLYAECRRCGQQHQIAHLHQSNVEKVLWDHNTGRGIR